MKQALTIFIFLSFFTMSLNAKLITNSLYDVNSHPFGDYSYPYESNMSDDNNYQISLIESEQDVTNKINPKYEKLIIELAYLQVLAVGTIGVIAVLPEGVSNWTEEDKTFADGQELLAKHAENIAKGPVVDNDSVAINYLGHSVAGSYFYVWGRQSGLSWQESAVLTTLMSTFFWEYGWEAFAEVPSTQDLIITPLLGSILGEGTNYLYNKLMDNDGKIYDSIILGGIGRTLLNPIGEVNGMLDSAFDAANIEISVDYAYNENVDNYRLRNTIENNGQIQSYFKLNFKLKY